MAAAMCFRVGTRKLIRKYIASIRIIGEKSMEPPKTGIMRLMRDRTGSVTSCRKQKADNRVVRVRIYPGKNGPPYYNPHIHPKQDFYQLGKSK
jgi:hypothetical protein